MTPDQYTNKQKKRARKLDEKQYIQYGPKVVTGLFHRTQTRDFNTVEALVSDRLANSKKWL